ncbi:MULTISPECIES: NUDIX domain-containing protein [Staphylococcus]|jgi:predicted NUDIX family phosphoesterase|uniref:NUDIX domain-containing protein n=1 Tax=Staphylococcus hominis TaxID=1290 RepID=A0A4Q9WQS2_STAHO|nr:MULTISPECIES: NUDIX domain-containing protein [Staphylococcus]EUZ70577.1 MutT/nudix family protein [Staphylococcus sp. M0480]MBF9294789.1 NUDIX domain-containing protein [Staphylococcus epidermidis]OFK81866.1 DNA mismatch repair protein MutT [Staphylococcus sp. HMSC057A02]OFM61973.1 DNA mismatch repair protein MutT [Staphylococcus sp. HMSC062C01]OFM62363.1 DNA mismatch repair protein MutT [Staphylococcus sp. HMSC068D07]OFM77432.1 DNA mismatch repair protein MutT [Staphylococcus sp. HMSC074
MSKFDEQIIVVSRELLFDNEKNAFNGFLSKNDVQGEEIFNTFKNYEVKRRGDMEEDPSYKQLISYCLLENENDEILVYQRLSGGGEERLHGQSSVGVGGHMNNVVGADSINEVLRVNAQRELNEEVGLSEDRSQNMEYIGFINDDTNAVGKVHIGVVFKIKVKSSDVEVRETDTLKINWVSQDEINDLNHFESWSALILKDLK